MNQLNQHWYVVGPPWADRQVDGALISIGSIDPNQSIGLINISTSSDIEEGRGVELASYICQLHNEKLTERGVIV